MLRGYALAALLTPIRDFQSPSPAVQRSHSLAFEYPDLGYAYNIFARFWVRHVAELGSVCRCMCSVDGAKAGSALIRWFTHREVAVL